MSNAEKVESMLRMCLSHAADRGRLEDSLEALRRLRAAEEACAAGIKIRDAIHAAPSNTPCLPMFIRGWDDFSRALDAWRKRT